MCAKVLKVVGQTVTRTKGVKFFPLVEEVGVLRYTRLAVGRGLGVYAIYSEYTKKFKGIAVNDGRGYREGTLKDLENALNES